MTDDATIEAAIVMLCAERGAGKTICPSDAARAVWGDDPKAWRTGLKAVRRVAADMAGRGVIAVYRKGKAVADPHAVKGVIRLGLPDD
jgi:hypothetical protein